MIPVFCMAGCPRAGWRRQFLGKALLPRMPPKGKGRINQGRQKTLLCENKALRRQMRQGGRHGRNEVYHRLLFLLSNA